MPAHGLPPGRQVPPLVNAWRYTRDPLGYIRSYHERYGPVACSRFPGVGLAIIVADPELVKQIFSADPALARAGEANATVLEPTVGVNSVLTLDERPHMRQRKLLLSPFHGSNVSRWGETIRAIAVRDTEQWPVSEPFPLRERTQRITLEVILRAVFGVRDEERFQRAQILIDRFARRAHPISLFRFARRDLGPWSPWARFKRARAELDAFLYEEISLRRAEDLAERDDVLSLLLGAHDEHGQPMSDAELRDELVTVIGAGHETTATAVAWAFERLLRTPEVMERLQRSLPEGGDEYLDATIKETLRIRPVIPEAARRLSREIELGGYRLPAGALVMPAIAAIHFREDLYPEPDEFRPERFLEGAPESYTWIPFGGGVRRCIGASFAQFEMRTIIRAILERAQLRVEDYAPERPRVRNITLAPERGCEVVLERRSQAGRSMPAGEAMAAT